ncbi:MAG: GNAT family N-acetyltransferase, partial [Methanobrevibacter sp.]|nr:GNAT family N-acetyltransferase [Methanobrevibacter sp.]
DDDFYICELAICSNQRGKGYGTEALNQLIQLAKDLDCRRVVLDADFRNDGAFRLYSSKGFKIFNRKSFGIPGKKRGMRNMELILK